MRCSLQGAFLLLFSRSRHSPQCTVHSAQHVWRGPEWRPAMRLAPRLASAVPGVRRSFTTQLTKSRIQAQKKRSAGVQAKSKGEKPDGRRSPFFRAFFAVCALCHALCPLTSETPASQQNTQNLDYSYHKPTLPLLRLSNFCPSLLYNHPAAVEKTFTVPARCARRRSWALSYQIARARGALRLLASLLRFLLPHLWAEEVPSSHDRLEEHTPSPRECL